MFRRICSNFKPYLHCQSLWKYPCINITYSTNQRIPSTVRSLYVELNNVRFHYIRAGHGDHPLLLLPGIIGSSNDFLLQLEHLDHSKYTMIAFDPQGLGKSRPPDRTKETDWTEDWMERDATDAAGLMLHIGFSRFSVLGWSCGGTSALFLASKFPTVVKKAIVVAAQSYYTLEDVDQFMVMKDDDGFTDTTRDALHARLGKEIDLSKTLTKKHMGQIWNSYCDILYAKFTDAARGDWLNDEALEQIKCPTFILHGAKDRIVPQNHALRLKDYIDNSRIYVMKDGEHNIHISHYEEFNSLVERFLENDEDEYLKKNVYMRSSYEVPEWHEDRMYPNPTLQYYFKNDDDEGLKESYWNFKHWEAENNIPDNIGDFTPPIKPGKGPHAWVFEIPEKLLDWPKYPHWMRQYVKHRPLNYEELASEAAYKESEEQYDRTKWVEWKEKDIVMGKGARGHDEHSHTLSHRWR